MDEFGTPYRPIIDLKMFHYANAHAQSSINTLILHAIFNFTAHTFISHAGNIYGIFFNL